MKLFLSEKAENTLNELRLSVSSIFQTTSKKKQYLVNVLFLFIVKSFEKYSLANEINSITT